MRKEMIDAINRLICLEDFLQDKSSKDNLIQFRKSVPVVNELGVSYYVDGVFVDNKGKLRATCAELYSENIGSFLLDECDYDNTVEKVFDGVSKMVLKQFDKAYPELDIDTDVFKFALIQYQSMAKNKIEYLSGLRDFILWNKDEEAFINKVLNNR